MKKISIFLLLATFGFAACDLQPRIKALPDTVGDFITERYPTLLADPNAQPEIYNSAATDYGVYASPEIYGSSDVDNYVLYSSVDDYIVPPDEEELAVQEEVVEEATEVAKEETQEEPQEKEDTEEFASDDVLTIPERATEPVKETASQEVPEPKESEDDINWKDDSTSDDELNVPRYSDGEFVTVVRGDTLYLIGKKYNLTVAELAKMNNLSDPYVLKVGQKLRIRAAEPVATEKPKSEPKAELKPEPKPETKTEPKPEPKKEVKAEKKPVAKVDASRKTTTRVDVEHITVTPGDTLYSLSRKYSIPVNDLAVMNDLTAPFALYAGQKLKVPDLSTAPVRTAKPSETKPVKTESAPATKQTDKPKTEQKQSAKPGQKQTEKQPVKQATKQAQKPAQKADKKQPTQNPKAKPTTAAAKKPAIMARSSSRFSWPVRGKILSNYGAKTNGLFNDGINIGAVRGSSVLAAENGVVAYAGNEVKGMGNLVIIQHSDGWMTVYAHMDSMLVRRGSRVGVGQKIGTVGQTGKVDKPQLHFEVRKGTKAYNPIQYLKK
ncbi:MAG: peptidoglycan DD-metalloendopeptidase family protein [Alphaproteobacteria bacterium]|nr:peptidoglycan DD-metalloendopeptidase family protein [Alphaproteobacteria bacterium]